MTGNNMESWRRKAKHYEGLANYYQNKYEVLKLLLENYGAPVNLTEATYESSKLLCTNTNNLEKETNND